MKYNTMNAYVTGTNDNGDKFTTPLKFIMCPPKAGRHYGTGYYMIVEMPGDRILVDVRYERTTDVEILADKWIYSYFGTNAQEVSKVFPDA